MSLDIETKKEVAEELHRRFVGSNAAFLVSCSGCTCAEITGVRRELHSSGSHFAVVKNKLAERAVKDTTAAVLSDFFKGPVAVAWSDKDPVASAKVLVKVAKALEKFTLKGAVLDGKVISVEEIEALASLPSKVQLFGKLLALMNAPAQRLMQTINAPASGLARLLEAWRTELETKQGGQ